MTRQRRALPFPDWPEIDRILWTRAFEEGVLFDAAGAGARWASATRAQVQNGYGLWLGYLAAKGALRADLLPCERLVVAHLEGYVAQLSARVAPVSVASRMRDLAEALRIMDPEGDRGLVVRALRRLEWVARPSRDIRRRLVAPTDVYEAGIQRMQRMMAATTCGPMIRAIHYSDGLRIAMLAAKPVRLRNLVDTRIGRNLLKVGDAYLWRFARNETKTHELIEAALPVRLTAYIDQWIDGCRRELLSSYETDALWLSLRCKPMGRAAIYQRVCIATEEELGVRINPHAFRAIVATGVAIAMPEQVQLTPVPARSQVGSDRQRTLQSGGHLVGQRQVPGTARGPAQAGARQRGPTEVKHARRTLLALQQRPPVDVEPRRSTSPVRSAGRAKWLDHRRRLSGCGHQRHAQRPQGLLEPPQPTRWPASSISWWRRAWIG